MQPTDIPQFRVMKRKHLLYRAVQDEIKSYIMRHSLKPGDPLPTEIELAQQLDISRNSVREAVKSLEALGILEAKAGTGLFVRDFSFDSILENLPYGIMFNLKQLTDILEIRFHIEHGMMERVNQTVTPEQLGRLHELLAHMRTAAQQGKYSAEDDRNFHQVLYENVNNSLLQMTLDIFWMVFRQAQEQANLPDPRDPMDTYRRHEAIVKALEKRDIEVMRKAMKLHYLGIETRVRQLQEANKQKS